MTDYNKMPAEMLGEGSTIKLERCETEVDLYWRVAMDVLSVIEEKTARDNDNYVENVGNKGSRRVELSHCLEGAASRIHEELVATLELLLLLVCIGERLRYANARDAALKGGVYF